jgi:hypothetical protein
VPRRQTQPVSAPLESVEFNTRLCGTMYDLDNDFVCQIFDGVPILPDHLIQIDRAEASSLADTVKESIPKKKRRRVFVGEPQPSWNFIQEPEEHFFVGQQRRHYLPPGQVMANSGRTYVGKSTVFKQNYITLSWVLDDPSEDEDDHRRSSSPDPSDTSSSLTPPPRDIDWPPYEISRVLSSGPSSNTSRSGFDGQSGFHINFTSQQQENLNPNFVLSPELIRQALDALQLENNQIF